MCNNALEILKGHYLKPANQIYVTHSFATHKQIAGLYLDEYRQALKVLAKESD